MPRKNRPPPPPLRSATSWMSFNEAAARCRGKTHVGDVDAARDAWASMRPRPDAAEKQIEGNPVFLHSCVLQ